MKAARYREQHGRLVDAARVRVPTLLRRLAAQRARASLLATDALPRAKSVLADIEKSEVASLIPVDQLISAHRAVGELLLEQADSYSDAFGAALDLAAELPPKATWTAAPEVAPAADGGPSGGGDSTSNERPRGAGARHPRSFEALRPQHVMTTSSSRSNARGSLGRRALLSVLWISASACHKGESTKPPPAFSVEKDAVTLAPGTPRPVSFATTKAERGPHLPPPPATGRALTVETLTSPSFAPLAGHVAEVRVRLGEKVTEGDKLVRIRTQDLSTLHHDLESASLAIKTKQAIYDRTKILVENHAATQNDLLVAQSELDEAKLAATSAGAKIDSLSVKFDDPTSFWLVATRTGTVVDLAAAPGQEVGPDKDHAVVTIADLDELVVIADLKPRDAVVVRPGATANIRLAGAIGDPVAGSVEMVSEVIDPDRQTVPVRIRVPNKDRKLMANAFVDVVIEGAADGDVVLVPTAAVVSDGADAVVFVESEPGKFLRRKVELGRQSKDKTEIAVGLAAGEPVVTEGALLLLNSLDVED